MDDSTLVVEIALSVNLASLTIEQVIGKRLKMLSDMVPGLKDELRMQLQTEGIATQQGLDFFAAKLAARCKSGPLRHASEWYNEDEQLSSALKSMLELKAQLGPGSVERARVLSELSPDECSACGRRAARSQFWRRSTY